MADDVHPKAEEVTPVLDAREITKHYDGVTALDRASLSVRPGEIHALLGGNGAGKSTMVSIISGANKFDQGSILLDGEPLTATSPQGAILAGIATIYQELSLVPALSALDNIFLGRELHRRVLGVPLVSDRRRMEERVRDLAIDFGISPSELRTPVSEFGALKKRSLEIVKALAFSPRVLILDEPTSGLEDAERASLFDYMRTLRNRNVALVWVTHHLEELSGLADRATIFRDGRSVATVEIADTSIELLLTHMFGDQREEFGGGDTRHLNRLTPLNDAPVVMSVRGLSRGPLVRDISFDVHEGEVVGLAGLAGAGRTEVVRTLMGLDRATSGTVELDGRKITPRSSSAAYNAGLAMLPEDRKQLGILAELSIASNISISKLSTVSKWRFWLSARHERALAEKYRTRLDIKAPSVNTRIGNLSGGNQQKAIVARCLNTSPRLLIFDEPTQGIDVSAKVDVHALIRHFSADGGAAILIASEFEELLELSHRVLVLKKGRIVGEFRDIPQTIASGGFAELKSKVLALSAAGVVA